MPYKNKADQRASAHRHYRAHSEVMKARAAEYKRRQRQVLKGYITQAKATPCKDCGGSFTAPIMEFDHLHNKTRNVSEMVNAAVSLHTLKEEIAKCEVVCANCHRIRTFKRREGSSPSPAIMPLEDLSGVAIRCGQDHPDEYGKVGGQDVKRGVAHNTPIQGLQLMQVSLGAKR